MLQSLRTKTLASAIGLSLLAGGYSIAASAAGAAHLSAAVQTVASEPYIVTFAEDGLMHYRGGVQGIPALRASANGRAQKVDVHGVAAVAYRNYLQTQRQTHIAAAESTLGRTLAVTHQYSITQNGIAADMTAAEAAALAATPGVKSVRRAGVEHQVTFRGPKFIGADKIWDGTDTPSGTGTRGEGVVVGDFDGGTNSDHPSFANDPVCGFSETAPKLTAVDCSTTNAQGECNGPNPEANPGFGHGVHTSSTAAGNTIDNTATPPPALPDGVSMSGVAPCAAIHQYKVCATNSCAGAAIQAAIENSIVDQVDVVNFSISGGTDPWQDNDRGFLDMVDADIFVAAAAGNLQTGETDPTGLVNHLGPWVATIAASTQDEILSPILSVTGPGTPPAALSAIPLIPGSTTTSTPTFTDKPLKSYPTNIEGCTASGGIPSGTFTGDIAVMRRGTCAFTEKITNAFNAGAVMVVIGNNQPGSINMDTTGAPNVPAYSIDQAPGDALIAFVADNESSAVGDVAPSGIGNVQGDVLASFSYTGPTSGDYANLTKPDTSAPGVNIYAATDDQDGNYTLMSGTSMATPHVTGSGALLKAVHPDWTPTQVKSAIQTTGVGGFQVDGTTPWTIDEVGSGRVNLTEAALVGFTFDETFDNYLAADPNGGTIDPKDLNIPSLRNSACNTSGCTWTRTIKSQLGESASYTATYTGAGGANDDATVTVDPATFTLAAGATQDITVTATPGSAAALQFGNIVFHEANGLAPDQHLTVAVKPGSGGGGTDPDIDVTPTSLTASQDPDQTTDQTLTVANVGGGTLTFNVQSDGTSPPVSIVSQPGPDAAGDGIVSDFFTPLSGGTYSADDFSVTSTTSVSQLSANGFINNGNLSTAASTIDFFIYPDAGGEPAGQPEDGTNSYVWTYSAAPTAAGVDVTNDQITLDLAAAGAPALNLAPGTYWIIVAPHVNVDASDGQVRWNWFASDGSNNSGNDALLNDPDSIFGGTDGWANIADLTGTPAFAGLAFSVSGGGGACGAPWLSVAPTSGSVAGGDSTDLDVTFDSTGLAGGTYTANICLASNDPDEATVAVPVTLTVTGGSDDIIFQDGFDGTGPVQPR